MNAPIGWASKELGYAHIETVMAHACAAFGVTLEDMLGRRKPAKLSLARQVAMCVARRGGATLNEIAHAFQRDHTTILHACRKVEALLKTDESLRYVVERMELEVSE